MSQRCPEFVDPWNLCELGREIEGRFGLSEFTRLTPLLASTEGEAMFALQFGRDEEQRPIVSGRVRSELTLECQRCLQAMSLVVDSSVELSPVAGLDESARLPDTLDPLLVSDQRVRLRDIVEDELIMAVPVIPRHPDDQCRPASEPAADPESGSSGNDHPFSVLAALKSNGEPSGSTD